MLLFKMHGLSVRQLRQDDEKFLLKWLMTPEVLEFYEGRDHPFNLQLVREKFYSQDDGIQRNSV